LSSTLYTVQERQVVKKRGEPADKRGRNDYFSLRSG